LIQRGSINSVKTLEIGTPFGTAHAHLDSADKIFRLDATACAVAEDERGSRLMLRWRTPHARWE
jgi:hypothetical protein